MCTCVFTYAFVHSYVYMHIHAHTCVSFLMYTYSNTRCHYKYVIRSLNVRLIADLNRGCDLFHTSGRKSSGVWRWWATGRPIYYKAWPPREPSGNGNFLYVWNRRTPAWGTWDDDEDRKKCFVCERRIKVPSYC